MTDYNKQTKVQISLYASKLKNMAGLGKGVSDPFAVVTRLAGGPQDRPDILGKTEVIKNTLSPAWTTIFETTYTFGTETRINVGVYDEVRKTGKNKPMGSAMFELGEVLGARGNIKAKKLKNGGTLFVRVTQAAKVQSGTLQLAFRGIKLKNVDGMFSKSDPFFVINAQTNDAGGRTWHPVYRSEVIKNNLNPSWNTFTIAMDKLCGGDKNRPILVELFDWEKSGKHQTMGKFETNANAMLSAATTGGGSFFPIHKGKKYGTLNLLRVNLTGENLNAPMPATAASVVQKASTATEGGVPKKFIKINGVTKINPDFKKYKEAQKAAAPAEAPQPTPAPPSAPAQPSFGQALDNQPSASYGSLPPAMPPPAVPQQASAPQASVPPQPFSPQAPPQPFTPPTQSTVSYGPGNEPKFVDYLTGGTEINLSVAIDFTGSNGDPRKPGTLHYIHRDGQLNDYEKAVSAVGSIVARYDTDQMFPVLGFGAKYGGVIQHCFQVGSAPELEGVGGMIEGYRGVFKTGLTMSGPTVFAEVIQFAAAQAQSKQDACAAVGEQSYSILLILTDGAVTDIESTKHAIRQASSAPLSIVIVGIGSADFSKMQFLDDFQRDEGGRTRDIVQFVEFSRHQHNKASLTRETLDEIPEQLVGYFYGKGIMPMKPETGSTLNIYEEEYDSQRDVDLTVDAGADGEINLSDPTAATWDGQTYGNAATFGLAPQQSMQSVYTPPAAAPPAGNPGAFVPPGGSTGAYAPPGGNAGGYAPPGGNTGGYAPPGGNTGGYAPPGGNTGGYAPPGGATGGYAPPASNYGAPGGSYASRPSATTPPAQAGNMVRIQAPSNAYPGMQLQVKNPATGQFCVVAVPPGVAPGAMFAVRF